MGVVAISPMWTQDECRVYILKINNRPPKPRNMCIGYVADWVLLCKIACNVEYIHLYSSGEWGPWINSFGQKDLIMYTTVKTSPFNFRFLPLIQNFCCKTNVLTLDYNFPSCMVVPKQFDYFEHFCQQKTIFSKMFCASS